MDACRGDVKIAHQSVTYDYFKRQLSDQQKGPGDTLCRSLRREMIAKNALCEEVVLLQTLLRE